MSLGALDFGLLVDGGVVMVEAIFVMSLSGGETFHQRLTYTVTQMARPVFFSILIIVLVYLPILSLSGVEGKMFRPMALTVVFALISALFLSLTYIPAAASLLFKENDQAHHDPWIISELHQAYASVLRRSISKPGQVLMLAVLPLTAGLIAFLLSGTTLFPSSMRAISWCKPLVLPISPSKRPSAKVPGWKRKSLGFPKSTRWLPASEARPSPPILWGWIKRMCLFNCMKNPFPFASN